MRDEGEWERSKKGKWKEAVERMSEFLSRMFLLIQQQPVEYLQQPRTKAKKEKKISQKKKTYVKRDAEKETSLSPDFSFSFPAEKKKKPTAQRTKSPITKKYKSQVYTYRQQYWYIIYMYKKIENTISPLISLFLLLKCQFKKNFFFRF